MVLSHCCETEIVSRLHVVSGSFGTLIHAYHSNQNVLRLPLPLSTLMIILSYFKRFSLSLQSVTKMAVALRVHGYCFFSQLAHDPAQWSFRLETCIDVAGRTSTSSIYRTQWQKMNTIKPSSTRKTCQVGLLKIPRFLEPDCCWCCCRYNGPKRLSRRGSDNEEVTS